MTERPPAVPLVVTLAGASVVCVGGGTVAAEKLAAVLAAGAHVHVIAPDLVAPLRSLSADGRLRWSPRRYERDDLAGALLAIAATDDPVTNAEVAADAEARGTLCVRVDGGGRAAFAAAVRRGPLLLAVSTSGTAPALARRLRAELEDRYGPEYGALATLLGELREDPEVQAHLRTLSDAERRAKWRAVVDPGILALLRAEEVRPAKELARACLFSSSD